jgi:hypothetical protein
MSGAGGDTASPSSSGNLTPASSGNSVQRIAVALRPVSFFQPFLVPVYPASVKLLHYVAALLGALWTVAFSTP